MAAGKTGGAQTVSQGLKYVRFPKRVTLGKARQHAEEQGLCGRSAFRRGLLAAGTPPPRLAAASARAWADRVASGGRWAITTVLRSPPCCERVWTAMAGCGLGGASVRQQLFWAMVGPWWREGASRLPRMPTGAGRLPCAGPTLRCELVLQPLRTSCRPAAVPNPHGASRVPIAVRWVRKERYERSGTRSARARGCGRARGLKSHCSFLCLASHGLASRAYRSG